MRLQLIFGAAFSLILSLLWLAFIILLGFKIMESKGTELNDPEFVGMIAVILALLCVASLFTRLLMDIERARLISDREAVHEASLHSEPFGSGEHPYQREFDASFD